MPLPIVKQEILDSLGQDFNRQYIDIIDRILEGNPVVGMVVKAFLEKMQEEHGDDAANYAACFVTYVYRLLESQAEADDLTNLMT